MSESDLISTEQGPSSPRDPGLGPPPGRPRGDAGRDLLFGLLGLQNNFIDREALLAAFNRWAIDRSRALGQILVEQGAMSPSRRAVLEALVAEHLELFDGDPGKSLAALGPISSVREDLSCIADADLTTSLAHVAAPTSRPGDDDPERTASYAVAGEATSAGTRFRILRPHARGGLGEVYIALDTELNREVALKEIQPRFADDSGYRARFEFEAEVTGGLEHPGVVPVYGLGHRPEGRPFYAMRFIRGDSLKEVVRRFHEAEARPGRDPGRSTLELRELLGRFLDVCDAMAYAHSRHVLHRDLKPSNIMLGKYGETLVVDWGLAKALDRPEPPGPADRSELPLRPSSGSHVEPTQAGSAVGTPGYMSPEQASGRLDQLGPWSDIYCLGATLYHILTGHAPCEGESAGEVLRKVQSGEIARPRSLNSQIAPALEAICLKALALDPGHRYESAEALKADLVRWLADEPVLAWREPIRTRLFRWARRHRLALSAAAACLLTAGVSLGIASSWLRQQRARAERQSQVLGNYMLASEALVEMIGVVADSPQAPGEAAPEPSLPPVSGASVVAIEALANPRPAALRQRDQQLAALQQRFRNIKSRLESEGQDQMARRIEGIIKRYDEAIKHELGGAAVTSLSELSTSEPLMMLGD